MILAIGYRVRSSRGTQFRKWATTHLQEYLVRGTSRKSEAIGVTIKQEILTLARAFNLISNIYISLSLSSSVDHQQASVLDGKVRQ